MWEDPIVAEVRRIREELLAEFDYDLEAYSAHIMALQEEDKRRGVKYAAPRADAPRGMRSSLDSRPTAAEQLERHTVEPEAA